jgi:hypothetical protein
MAMTKPRPVLAVIFLLFVTLAAVPATPVVRAAADTLPQRLTDAELWKLSEDMSEPNGSFRSDNLLSNEIYYPYVMTELQRLVGPSASVYMGVGPEQNFNYIALLKPKMVFITDIRRGNMHTHLMYKALFELSADRAEFVGRLFTKKRPDGLTAKSTAEEIMTAYWNVTTSGQSVYDENLKAIQDLLTRTHSLPLTREDVEGIANIYYNFYWFGPLINYNSSSAQNGRVGGGNMASYYDLMVAADGSPVGKSYLSSEETFKVIKDLHQRNLFVPVVGNFGGPKALRAVGKYVREHGATVSAFYLSNVEQYLTQDGIWGNFCANVATMPLDSHSTFIRSSQQRGGAGGSGLVNTLGPMLEETKGCGQPSRADVRMMR